MKNTKLIYLGSPRPDEETENLLKLGSHVNFASNTLQSALLRGFSKWISKLYIISSWPITPFPKIKRIHFKRKGTTNHFGGRFTYTGILNLPFINLISKFIRCRQEINNILSTEDDTSLFIYEVHSPFLLAAVTLRKKLRHICLIVPDMPQFMSGKTGIIHRLLKSIDWKIIKYCIKQIDSFVLLSEGMKDLLPIGEKPWILMEGIFEDNFLYDQSLKKEQKTIMYAGGIHRRRGTELLLEAFQKINDPEYRLWIRGDGELKSDIIALSKIDTRIKYIPPLSRNELLLMEQKASVLVNPTQPSLDFTNYFFPSKTMEYLASGTPTVMFKLSCMPQEYDEHLFYVEEESAEALKNKLVETCNIPVTHLRPHCEQARLFILSSKTPEYQCERILKLMNIL